MNRNEWETKICMWILWFMKHLIMSGDKKSSKRFTDSLELLNCLWYIEREASLTMNCCLVTQIPRNVVCWFKSRSLRWQCKPFPSEMLRFYGPFTSNKPKRNWFFLAKIYITEGNRSDFSEFQFFEINDKRKIAQQNEIERNERTNWLHKSHWTGICVCVSLSRSPF